MTVVHGSYYKRDRYICSIFREGSVVCANVFTRLANDPLGRGLCVATPHRRNMGRRSVRSPHLSASGYAPQETPNPQHCGLEKTIAIVTAATILLIAAIAGGLLRPVDSISSSRGVCKKETIDTFHVPASSSNDMTCMLFSEGRK